MEFVVSVSVALEKDGKFLIVKRADGDTYPGLWEFPSGRLDLGETLETTAKREVKEETGLTIKSLKYVGYSDRFPMDKHCLIHHFYSKNFTGKPELSYEHSEWKWVTLEEIFAMDKKTIGNDTLKYFELSA